LNGIQEVGGSIPPGSTIWLRATCFAGFALAFCREAGCPPED
jgi:hypothetical protein